VAFKVSVKLYFDTSITVCNDCRLTSMRRDFGEGILLFFLCTYINYHKKMRLNCQLLYLLLW